MPSTTLHGHTALVLTASDRCFAGLQEDRSGPAVARLLTAAGAEVVDLVVSTDDLSSLKEQLRLGVQRVALLVTTGGTGLAARDNTPEATLAVCERMVPGLAELIRQHGSQETPFAALGRGVCGVAGRCLVLNLPGNPKGAEHSLRAVLPLLPHALELLAGHTEHATAEAAAQSTPPARGQL